MGKFLKNLSSYNSIYFMNITDIKKFLENELLIKQLKLDTDVPSNLKINKPIIKQILNKYNWLQNANELIYLIKHKKVRSIT